MGIGPKRTTRGPIGTIGGGGIDIIKGPKKNSFGRHKKGLISVRRSSKYEDKSDGFERMLEEYEYGPGGNEDRHYKYEEEIRV